MSKFESARPHYKLPFAGEDYNLLGTFGMIEAIEIAMQKGIGQVTQEVVNGMPASGLVKLLTAILNVNGYQTTTSEVGAQLFEKVGLSGEEEQVLRFHVYSFLAITLAPPSQREQRAEDMGKLLGKLKDPKASPGESTEEPA